MTCLAQTAAHMAHINKYKTTVNISLFGYLLAEPITYNGVLCLCPEQTLFQVNASQPAEDACISHPFFPKINILPAAL